LDGIRPFRVARGVVVVDFERELTDNAAHPPQLAEHSERAAGRAIWAHAPRRWAPRGLADYLRITRPCQSRDLGRC